MDNFPLLVIAALLTSWAASASKKSAGTDADEYPFEPIFASYTTQNKGFRDSLSRVLLLLEDYATRSRVDRPLNLLLAASPGTGKSYLAKQIAKGLENNIKGSVHGKEGVAFEEVYIAAFRSADDLLGVFQRVQSANLRGYLPFVLFDEVDSKVEGKYLLSNFLAPMWDGKFHEGRESYALGPAIFCFAGSALLPSPTIPERKKGDTSLVTYEAFVEHWRKTVDDELAKSPSATSIEKLRDFVDRVDEKICIPPVDGTLLDLEAASKEYSDIAYSWVVKHFPTVKKIEKAVLVLLAKELVIEKTSRRAVEKCVFASTTPKDGTFNFSNLPQLVRIKYGEDAEVKANTSLFFAVRARK